MVCLRLFSSPKQLTRNRLKPVQTGRFHLGLVFSRWRRGKFVLTLRPRYTLIGDKRITMFLYKILLDILAVNLLQFTQAPTRSLHPWSEKEGGFRAEWTSRCLYEE